MRKLSTHVLDTAHGHPAAGMHFELWALVADGSPEGRRELRVRGVTNADGRSDGPLLSGDALVPGVYELVFAAGDYFRARAVPLSDPAFVDRVVLRFGVAEGGGAYHVPLLVSPWSWSSYRGS